MAIALAKAGTDGFAMYYGRRAFFGCTVAPDQRTWWFARVPGPCPAEAGPGSTDGIAAGDVTVDHV